MYIQSTSHCKSIFTHLNSPYLIFLIKFVIVVVSMVLKAIANVVLGYKAAKVARRAVENGATIAAQGGIKAAENASKILALAITKNVGSSLTCLDTNIQRLLSNMDGNVERILDFCRHADDNWRNVARDFDRTIHNGMIRISDAIFCGLFSIAFALFLGLLPNWLDYTTMSSIRDFISTVYKTEISWIYVVLSVLMYQQFSRGLEMLSMLYVDHVLMYVAIQGSSIPSPTTESQPVNNIPVGTILPYVGDLSARELAQQGYAICNGVSLQEQGISNATYTKAVPSLCDGRYLKGSSIEDASVHGRARAPTLEFRTEKFHRAPGITKRVLGSSTEFDTNSVFTGHWMDPDAVGLNARWVDDNPSEPSHYTVVYVIRVR